MFFCIYELSKQFCRFFVRFMYIQYLLSDMQVLQIVLQVIKVLQIINSQNINSPSGAICRVFDNFFLRLIRIIKFSRIITLYLFMFLRTSICAIISLELLAVMNINLNGSTAGSFPIASKISSIKSSENSPYALAIVPSSRNTQ